MDEFVTKDVCKLKHEDVEEVKEDIKEITTNIARMVEPLIKATQWIESHDKSHNKRSVSGWNIVMAIIAFGALAATVALGIIKG